MFTGIITDLGTITNIEDRGDKRFHISCHFDMATVAIGASIACSGACLTVIEKTHDSFVVDVSAETLARTNLGTWQKDTKINLERSLKMGDELGGHIVTGHVDGLAEVLEMKPIGDSHHIIFAAPPAFSKFIAEKGSVTIDGVSLTVNGVDKNRFWVNIIPHTWEKTTFHTLKLGSKVHLEIDVLARYIARWKEVEAA